MKKLILILPLLLILSSCSESNIETRELPTKYPETPTMGSADDVTKELYKK